MWHFGHIPCSRISVKSHGGFYMKRQRQGKDGLGQIATRPQSLCVDKVAERWHIPNVPVYTDVVKSMQQRLLHECERMQAARNEMDSLAEAYHRYKDLQEELSRREKRSKRLYALLFPDDLPASETVHTMFGQIDNPPEARRHTVMARTERVSRGGRGNKDQRCGFNASAILRQFGYTSKCRICCKSAS